MTVIDVHAHVTAPAELGNYRAGLLASRGGHTRSPLKVSDERIEGSLKAHLTEMTHHQIDLQLISPRPYTVMHWAKPEKIVRWYTEETNNLIARECQLHPNTFKGVCTLPQAPGVSPKFWVDELERCVKDLGFVGVQINPDPAEMGDDSTPAMGDEYWYPLYEKMVELNVPGLVHSAGCQSERLIFHLHFINEESIAIMSLLDSDVFEIFPSLKLVISHGGGAIPYQIGRFMAQWESHDERFDHALRKLYFDTCLYTKRSMELLLDTVGVDRCMFGTEVPGAGSHAHPDTGLPMDDLVPLIKSIDWLTDEDRYKIFEGNARSLYSLGAPVGAMA
ncbi:MAG: amidohydrolase [Chloroflexi bacterium]|nr:amidohydrolase [Chloroflexota bacterium]